MITREKYLEIRKTLESRHPFTKLAQQVVKDVFLIAAISTLVVSGWSLAAIPLVSILMFRGFSVMHDAVHGALLKNKKANRFLGIVYASLCLLPYEQWRAVHLDHHTWSGNIERDSVMAVVRFYPGLPAWQKAALNFFWRNWIPFLAVVQHSVFWWYCTKKLLSRGLTTSDILSYGAPMALAIAVVLTMPKIFVFATLPASLFLFFLFIEIVNLPHHLEMPQHSGETRFQAAQQYQTARTCIYPRWFAQNVVLNFNYHIEHHMYPDQPWYQLPEIHKMLKAQLHQAYNEDPMFEWILRNRRRDLALVLDYKKSMATAS